MGTGQDGRKRIGKVLWLGVGSADKYGMKNQQKITIDYDVIDGFDTIVKEARITGLFDESLSWAECQDILLERAVAREESRADWKPEYSVISGM